ncbi:CAMK/CAMKL/MARK protein kinase [Coprinopsis sp. MPI-PUGE-AT-0042]|nr:CAMK/CAMKL/MARK protein kinase [Coprinopsis sp. MPI-PUGE-AT-0042]
MPSSSSSRTSSPTSSGSRPASEEPTDTFSLSDETLRQELDFVEEIGQGNWGSVWLVRSKLSRKGSDHAAFHEGGRKFAVKMVHRKEKTPATAARIKSLWNEMKVVRHLKDDTHPSIVPFYTFVITPSYAMITMAYVPTVMPVEVEEAKARVWFRDLLSAVEYLHRMGVVHNDIKPANILLTNKNVPVLVDYGFAEKNDPEDETSFHSSLAYGTPEYLSPERARGLSHDTRKSDVWSLGVTFFEILNGRTPFEDYDGEFLDTKEAVEQYWARTLRGKWMGTWAGTPGMEKLLRRMMAPNADLRCTAAQALSDRYWVPARDAESKNAHRRSASALESLVFENDLDKLLNMTPTSSRVRRTVDASEGVISPPGLALPKHLAHSNSEHSLSRSRSQPKVNTFNSTRRRGAIPAIDLSPIKASPPASPYAKENAESRFRSKAVPAATAKGKENQPSRRAFGDVTSAADNNAIQPPPPLSSNIPIKSLHELTSQSRSGLAKGGRSASNLSVQRKEKTKENEPEEGDWSMTGSMRAKASNSVRDRVKEWEREKQRLREMQRLEELERERDEHYEREKERRREKRAEREKQKEMTENEEESPAQGEEKAANQAGAGVADDKEDLVGIDLHTRRRKTTPTHPPVLPLPPVMSPLSRVLNTFQASTPGSSTVLQSPAASGLPSSKQSKSKIFKHSIKASIDKTVQFCKGSSIGRSASATPSRGFSFDIVRELEKAGSRVHRESRDEIRRPQPEDVASPSGAATAQSPAQPLRPEDSISEAHMDRLALWMKDVEQVVEEAQAEFAAMAPKKEYSLPPAPLPSSRPQARRKRSTRLPRKLLAASQIFDENGQPSPVTSPAPPSSYSGPGTPRSGSTAPTTQNTSVVTSPPSAISTNFVIPEILTPSKQKRRATVSARSPGPLISGKFAEDMDSSMSTSELRSPPNNMKRNQSQSTLAKLGIMPLALDADGKKSTETLPRLADVVDRSLFVAPPFRSRDDLLDNQSFVFAREPSFDDLTGSPCHVEAYPSRHRPSADASFLDSSDRHKMEHVYDRFLMTSGVKRNGKGYQSEALAPISNTVGANHNANKRESFRPFGSTRKPMPPPVSSADMIEKLEKKAVAVDELGLMTNVEGEAGTTPLSSLAAKSEEGNGNGTVSLVRRAFKAMVPGRRLSRAF